VIHPLLSGRDITQTTRHFLAIDVSEYSEESLRREKPSVYQWLLDYVKPGRDQNNRESVRRNWWVYGEARNTFRPALKKLENLIATSLTSKHRFFIAANADTICDSTTVMFAVDDAFALGVLSSRIHVSWALSAGGRLGVGNDPRYNKTRCFETFPFPDLAPAGANPAGVGVSAAPLSSDQAVAGVGVSAAPPSAAQLTAADGADSDPSKKGADSDPSKKGADAAPSTKSADSDPSLLANRIRDLAEQLDGHRKRQQALHPGLTLTGMYNVLEKLRLQRAAAAIPTPALPTRGEGADVSPDNSKTAPPPRVGEAGRGSLELTPKEKTIHEQGLVSVLAELHDELDRAVFAAYGWSDLADALVGKPGGTTPYPDKPEAQAEAEEELLERLVALNHERAAEEARGLVRWLRPAFQNPDGEQAAQGEIAAGGSTEKPIAKTKKHPWPKTLPEQVQALRRVLAEQPAPLSAEQLARRFSRAQTKKVDELLLTLADLGQVRREDHLYRL